MIKTAITFNGAVELRLSPSNEEDKRLIELTFQGREVKSIKSASDGGVILEMIKPSMTTSGTTPAIL